MRTKETRLLLEQHVSEDPARKRWVLSEEAEAVPEESERSGASVHLLNVIKRKGLRLNSACPIYQKRVALTNKCW